MAKSQSETQRWIRRGEENDAWPGQKTHCEEPRFLVSLGTGSAIP